MSFDFSSVPMTELSIPSELDPNLPYATHQGSMTFGDFTFRVYRLSTGQMVIHGDDLLAFAEAGLGGA